MLKIVYTEAELRNIYVHHCSRGFYCEGDNGLPDLILVGSHRLAFWELKNSDYAGFSSAQKEWYWKLRGCGHEVRLVTPQDLPRVGEYLDKLNEEENVTSR